MNLDSKLLRRLEALAIGAGDASLRFHERLARENAWTNAYAQRVVGEYKRFLYLATRSGEQVTPSDQVDQAWHLHLTYTKSYWCDFCAGVLGRALHHEPTRGGGTEQRRYRKQYQRTLELYERVFASTPPEDIWPDTERRFADADRFVRVNRQRSWIIARPGVRERRLLLVGATSLLLAACGEYLAEQDIWFWLKAVFGVWVVYKIGSWIGSGGRGGGAGCGGGCGSACGGGD